MSRIVLQRHDTGGEKVVIGWDAPLQTYFAHEYDEEHHMVRHADPEPPRRFIQPIELFEQMLGAGFDPKLKVDLSLYQVLQLHQKLDYPESNVEVDMTKEKQDA